MGLGDSAVGSYDVIGSGPGMISTGILQSLTNGVEYRTSDKAIVTALSWPTARKRDRALQGPSYFKGTVLQRDPHRTVKRRGPAVQWKNSISSFWWKYTLHLRILIYRIHLDAFVRNLVVAERRRKGWPEVPIGHGLNYP